MGFANEALAETGVEEAAQLQSRKQRRVEKDPSAALAFVQVTEQWLTGHSAPASLRSSELPGLD